MSYCFLFFGVVLSLRIRACLLRRGQGTGMPWSLGSFASENRADFLIATRVLETVSCACMTRRGGIRQWRAGKSASRAGPGCPLFGTCLLSSCRTATRADGAARANAPQRLIHSRPLPGGARSHSAHRALRPFCLLFALCQRVHVAARWDRVAAPRTP